MASERDPISGVSKKPIPPQAGDVFRVPFPFSVETSGLMDDPDYSWKPGTRPEPRYDDVRYVADGTGEQILTVVSTHKPGTFPVRVFYTRRWKDPDGKEFGKRKLRVTSLGHFRQLTAGYRYDYDLQRKQLPARNAEVIQRGDEHGK